MTCNYLKIDFAFAKQYIPPKINYFNQKLVCQAKQHHTSYLQKEKKLQNNNLHSILSGEQTQEALLTYAHAHYLQMLLCGLES